MNIVSPAEADDALNDVTLVNGFLYVPESEPRELLSTNQTMSATRIETFALSVSPSMSTTLYEKLSTPSKPAGGS